MKLLKISFAALVAVATLGITLTSQAGLLNNKIAKAAVTDGCYRSVTVSIGTFDGSDTNDEINQCIGVTGNENHIVDGTTTSTLGTIAGLNVSAASTAVVVSTQCDTEAIPFCCFEVVEDEVVGICFGEFLN